VIAILHADGLAVDLTHEAALLASMGLVETYQMATELRLEHIGQEQDRGLQINASKAPRRRKLPEILNERAILGQRQDLEYAQRWIKDNPKPAQRDRIARSLLPWCGPVQAAYCSIEIPEEPDPGHALLNAVLGLIGRINAHSKEGHSHIIEVRAVCKDGIDCVSPLIIASGAKETQDDITPGRRIECIARIARRPLVKPRGRIAGEAERRKGADQKVRSWLRR